MYIQESQSILQTWGKRRHRIDIRCRILQAVQDQDQAVQLLQQGSRQQDQKAHPFRDTEDHVQSVSEEELLMWEVYLTIVNTLPLDVVKIFQSRNRIRVSVSSNCIESRSRVQLLQ